MGTAIQKTSGSCMGDFGDLRSQSSAGFPGAYQRGISVWGCSPKAVVMAMGDAPNNVGYRGQSRRTGYVVGESVVSQEQTHTSPPRNQWFITLRCWSGNISTTS